MEEIAKSIYKGISKGRVIELVDGAKLPEGVRVSVIPEESASTVPHRTLRLAEWLREARRVRAQLPETSDSVEILRRLREERASR